MVYTLLLYSFSPYTQTDWRTDGLTDGGTNTLASRGLEEPAHASRGLEEPCCVSFWFWREIGFGCTYYYVLGVPYNCGVVLVFLSSVWWVHDHYYNRKKIQSSVWRVCDHYYDRKTKIQSSVWRVRDHYYDQKKKDTVVCLAGARSCLSFLSQLLYLY